MKKLIKTICIVIALITVYKTISFGVDKIIEIGKDAKQRTEQQLSTKTNTTPEPTSTEVKQEEQPAKEENKIEKEKTFQEKLKEGTTQFTITNDFFKLYNQESTLKTTNLKDICRNENDYVGKTIYLSNMEVMTTKELETEGELLTCYQNSTDTALYLVYDYSQLKNKYMVGDKISTIGKVRNVRNVKGEYVPTIDTTYVFDTNDAGYILNIYNRLGTDKYEVRPSKPIPGKAIFDVYDLNTKEKLNDRILVENGKFYYWVDSKLNYGDIISKPAK